MDLYLRLIAGVFIAAIITLVLNEQEKSIALLLTLVVCTTVMISVSAYLEDILALVWDLTQIGEMEREWIHMILKIVGIGILSQISGTICTDTGNKTLGQIIQIMTNVVILWLCTPMIEQLLILLRSVLEELR